MSEWRVETVHGKTNVWGGVQITSVTHFLVEEDQRVGVVTTADIGARLIAALEDRERLVAALEQMICGYCGNRIGCTPDPATSPYPKQCRNGGCADARAALAAAASAPTERGGGETQ